ncbi:MAG: hypothetical protein H0V61_03730 [Chitinophagales bacterium]|nr:hypothetical protein [Chitinophagales bacterium]
MTEKQNKALNKRYNVAAKYRGFVIQQFCDIELMIDLVICRYFCDNINKSKELLHRLVSDKLDFNTKKILLGYILHNHYTKFIEDNPKFLSDLTKAQEFRNVLAHRKVFTRKKSDLDTFDGDNVWFENPYCKE